MDEPVPVDAPPKAKRGFAAMSPETRRRLQSMGGKACPDASRGFSDRKTAAKAGKIGVKSRWKKP